MSRIVVGYDGSPAAQAAVDWVATRVVRDGGIVQFVTVGNSVEISDDSRAAALLRAAERRLHDLAPASPVESHQVTGRMPGALIEDAREADILVIGVHRSRPVRSTLTGLLPAHLAAHVETPLCLVPDTWEPNNRPVTVGVDDDTSSDNALVFAAREAATQGIGLRVVHGWLMPAPTIDGTVTLLASPPQVKEAHRRILREAVQQCASVSLELDIEERLVPEEAASALRGAAPESSLIAIGTHHRGLLSAIAAGVAFEIIGQVDCPVCVVPA
ncbi:universal stress protein [Microbacterium sp. E-13]|uniref:universal stress protein n=1 Tax=Microbacterium sp. E-13 TaxID=3404048 RepID=UPI003CEBD01F